MEDLRSNYYKLMWVPESSELIWDMVTETQVNRPHLLYLSLEKNINFNIWIKDFENLYKAWLNDESEELYNIKNSVHTSILAAIHLTNLEIKSKNIKLFYWFDIDRTFNENFHWEFSPINGEKLTRLSQKFHFLNRLISEKSNLVLPEISNKIINTY